MKKYFLALCLLSTLPPMIFAGEEELVGNIHQVSRATFEVVSEYYRTGIMPEPELVFVQYGFGAITIKTDLNKIKRAEGLPSNIQDEDIPAYACKLGIVLQCGNDELNCRDVAPDYVLAHANDLPDIIQPKAKAPRTPKEKPNTAPRKNSAKKESAPKAASVLKNEGPSLLGRVISSTLFKSTCAATIAGLITYYAVKKYNKDKEERKDRYSKKRLALAAAAVVGASTFTLLQYMATPVAQK